MIKLILSFALVTLFSVSVQAELVTFTIEKDVFESMTPNQRNAVIAKASDLNEFLKQSVYPKIPSAIKNQLGDFSVIVSFQNKMTRDGLFIPEENRTKKISLSLLQLNSNGLKALVAHEFFHALHFELNPGEEPWMREGLAQLFEYMVTNELSGKNLQAALANPFTPLIGEYDINNPNPAQYGHNLLYFFYLYNHCGKDNLFWKITKGNEQDKGSELINSLLQNQANAKAPLECQNFYQSALSFEAAKVHNQVQFTKEQDSERFFLAPTNLPVRAASFESRQKLLDTINSMPEWSSLRVKLEDWTSIALFVKGVKIFYASKSFPYEVSEDASSLIVKNTEVIIVKTAVLTEVSLKNSQAGHRN